MLSHGLISGALFLCVGVIYDRMHTREIAFYGGPSPAACRSTHGVPAVHHGQRGPAGTSGFVGEVLTMTGTYQVSSWTAILAASGVILSPCTP
jgi:NADH-quinone oxidoreductase subunit M